RPAVELLDFLQGGLGTAHNSALSACEKARQWRVALVLLSQHPQPSRVSFNAVLSAVERWDQALEILRTMTLQRITADLVTYTAIVSSCATASHLSTSLEMLEKMKQDSVQPRSLAYNAVLHACADSLAWRCALQIFGEARAAEALDPLALQALMASLSGAGQFRTVNQLMPRVSRTLSLGWLLSKAKNCRGAFGGSMSPDPAALEAACWRLLQLLPQSTHLCDRLQRSLRPSAFRTLLVALKANAPEEMRAPFGLGTLPSLLVLQEFQLASKLSRTTSPCSRESLEALEPSVQLMGR
ncbi:Pentatricopeptide repeat-containing protein At1g74850, partial [Durusdinium trenchii]